MDGIKTIFLIFIIAVLAGSLVPTGINSLENNENSSWANTTVGSGLNATYNSIAILIAVAIVAVIAGMAYRQLE